jgi:hypothetical protein
MFSFEPRCHGEWASQKKHPSAGLLADPLVHRQFLALIPGQRAAQLGG